MLQPKTRLGWPHARRGAARAGAEAGTPRKSGHRLLRFIGRWQVPSLKKSEGETDELGLVLSVLVDGEAQVDRERGLPEERQDQPDARPALERMVPNSHVRLDVAGVHETTPRMFSPISGKITSAVPVREKSPPTGSSAWPGAGLDAAESEPADAPDAAAVEPLEEDRVAERDEPGLPVEVRTVLRSSRSSETVWYMSWER